MFPVRGGGEYALSDGRIARWQAIYRGVDVGEELAKAREWLLANPTKAKSNIPRFIVNWLNTASERLKKQRIDGAYVEPPGARSDGEYDRAWSAAYLEARQNGLPINEAVQIAKARAMEE